MDAAAYLKKQGWRGTGHSLDHTDRGIVKPLQISKKVDALGVGIQKYAAVSDQWWLRAYDQGLKDLGTGKESALATAKKHGVNRGGLYARFVRGTEIPGTIGQRVAPASGTPIVVSVKSVRAKGNVDEEQVKSRKRKRAQGSVIIDPQVSVLQQINGYVVEARRRGVLATDITVKSTSTSVPDDEDMKAVLRLAKLHKASRRATTDEKSKIRQLKRAALQYLEQQMISAPT